MRNDRRWWLSKFGAATGVLALAVAAGACSGEVRDEGAGPGRDAGVDASSGDRACAAQDECALVSATCCGVCGQPAARNMAGVRWDRTEAFSRTLCGPTPPPCPECAETANPHLTAVCRGGLCAAVDVREDDALAGCATDADCTLRYGTACCEGCAGTPDDLTALRKDRVEGAVRCAPNEGACPACEPVYPRSARARCNPSTKRCEVAITR
jgi:hypothetical protein